jgi:uncharacterized protein with HEPN domain
MPISPLEYLRHMQDEIDYILLHSTTLSKEKFTENETLKRAFIRSIEIIGEASKKIPNDIKVQYSQVEWRSISGMRDKLVHDYFGVDYDLVWDVVINKIPQLKVQIAEMIKDQI